jgi:hypothetical protein
MTVAQGQLAASRRVRPVPEAKVGRLAALGAGQEAGEPAVADVGEPLLRTGVRAVLADEDAHALWPGRQAQHAGSVWRPRRQAPPAYDRHRPGRAPRREACGWRRRRRRSR